METIIGIDVRQRQHYAVAITERGEQSFVFTHRRIGFENFSKWISEVAPLPRAFAINSNEPFTCAVAAWLRGNGETVHVSEGQASARQLAQRLRGGSVAEQRPQRQSVRELLDLAVFYLRISIAAMS